MIITINILSKFKNPPFNKNIQFERIKTVRASPL